MKTWVMIGMGVGTTAGSLLPFIFPISQDAKVGWSIVGSVIGGLLGVWAGYKAAKALY